MLYLHIGAGKAGSTTIQNFLGQNVDLEFGHSQVRSFGLGHADLLAAAANTPLAHSYWVTRRQVFTEAELAEIRRTLWMNAASEVAGGAQNKFVASSEFILASYGSDEKQLERLRLNLEEIFGNFKIIVYLREQVSYLKSLYSQGVKGPMRNTATWAQTVKNMENSQYMWDYSLVLRNWHEVFGLDSISLKCFSEENFVGKNLVTDFLHQIDVNHKYINRDIHNWRERANVSPKYHQIQLMRLGNAARKRPLLRLPGEAIRRIAASRTVRGLDSEFPRWADRIILEKVSEGNDWINRRFLTDQPVKLPTLD